MEYENNLILVEKLDGKVALVTMNNPPLNTNTLESIAELREVFRRLDTDDTVNAIVLTGSGTRAFNVGSDISHFSEWVGNYVGRKFKLENDTMNAIELCSKPVIAAIEGYCMGGGLEIALACDFRYVSEASIISAPEIDLGVFSASGGIIRLAKLVGRSKALEINYFCGKYSAQECLDMGLADKLFPAGEVKTAAITAATRLAAKPPKALRATKKGVRDFLHKDSIDCYYRNLEMVEEVFNDYNAQEGVQAFLEKRTANFKL